MRSRKKSFRHQSLQDEKSIQDIFKAITSGIARGKITFSDEDEKIVMRPQGLLELKVTANQEENRNRFNIRVSWQLPDDGGEKEKIIVREMMSRTMRVSLQEHCTPAPIAARRRTGI